MKFPRPAVSFYIATAHKMMSLNRHISYSKITDTEIPQLWPTHFKNGKNENTQWRLDPKNKQIRRIHREEREEHEGGILWSGYFYCS